MVKIELTVNQLNDLVEVLEYVSNCEYNHYQEYLEEGNSGDNHIYTKVTELRTLKWTAV